MIRKTLRRIRPMRGVFLMAADLIESGADNALCIQELYKRRSLASIRMKAKMLSHARLECSGKVVSTLVEKRFFEETGAYEVDCEEALHESLDLVSVEVALDASAYKRRTHQRIPA